MNIERLSIKHERCIKKADLSFDRLNIIYGNNGQGKTSLLEAIYILAFTKSHKTNVDKEVIQKDQEFLTVHATVQKEGYQHTLELNMTPQQKKVKIDSSIISKLSDYVGYLNVVLFSPDDLTLIKGEPGNRRRFMDMELGQVNHAFIQDLLLYRAVLKQRNELLKKMQTEDQPNTVLLETITEQLAGYGTKIQQFRKEFIDSLNRWLQPIHMKISNNKEQLKITYEPKTKGNLYEELMARVSLDTIRGATSLGPHRDDFTLWLNNEDASKFGSQGQQRSAVLSLKLALIEFIRAHTSEFPVLLLDDVFSELDESRLNNLVEYLNPEIQTIISTTDVGLLHPNILKEAKLIHVNQGQFEEGEKHE